MAGYDNEGSFGPVIGSGRTRADACHVADVAPSGGLTGGVAIARSRRASSAAAPEDVRRLPSCDPGFFAVDP
jgi:hypothetical protein